MTRAGAEIRGEVLAALAVLRQATPVQLHQLLLPHQRATDNIRRALRDLAGEKPSLAARSMRANQGYWCCTPAGLDEAAAAGVLPAGKGARRRAAKTGLREHGVAVTEAACAFHRAGCAHWSDWRLEVSHPTSAGSLLPDAVVLLDSGRYAFLELDRTMSYAGLLDKVGRYDAYRTAPPADRGNAAHIPRTHWQHHYGAGRLDAPFPPLLIVFAPAPRRAHPGTREEEFLSRAAGLDPVRLRRMTVTLARLAAAGPQASVWRVAGRCPVPSNLDRPGQPICAPVEGSSPPGGSRLSRSLGSNCLEMLFHMKLSRQSGAASAQPSRAPRTFSWEIVCVW